MIQFHWHLCEYISGKKTFTGISTVLCGSSNVYCVAMWSHVIEKLAYKATPPNLPFRTAHVASVVEVKFPHLLRFVERARANVGALLLG